MRGAQEARVRDYMSTRLVTLDPQMDVLAAMRRLLDRQISGAPVVDAHGNLVGILTQRDCLEVAIQSSYHQEPAGRVAEFMSHPVTTVFADTGIVEVIEAFRSSPYRRFPVMEGARLVGQISRRDILRAILDFG
jgi:CBS domain-containing protein